MVGASCASLILANVRMWIGGRNAGKKAARIAFDASCSSPGLPLADAPVLSKWGGFLALPFGDMDRAVTPPNPV